MSIRGGKTGRAPTIAFASIGCKANREEMECLLSRLEDAGYRVVPFGSAADWTVVNTCTVTAEGESDSRQAARRAARGKGGGRVVVTGCLAQRDPGGLAALAGVDWVLGNAEKADLADWILGAGRAPAGGAAPAASGAMVEGASGAPVAEAAGAPERTPAGTPAPVTTEAGPDAAASGPGTPAGARIRVRRDPSIASFPAYGAGRDGRRARASLKVQDGCDARCTYCVIPSVRGSSRSRPLDDCLRQARLLAASGYREIVLTGINTSLWGADLDGSPELPDLVEALMSVEGLLRVRLNSLEPQAVRPDWLDRLAASPRLCRHYHLPLQSGSARILRRMGRPYDPELYHRLVLAVRELLPDAAVGADVLVGFPGETEEDFAATERLIAELPLSYLHVFRYSPRPGTASPRLGPAADPEVARERSARLRALSRERQERFRRDLLGTVQDVLPERPCGEGSWQGLTGNYLRVRFPWDEAAGGKELLDRALPRVRLEALRPDGLLEGVLAGGGRAPASRRGGEA